MKGLLILDRHINMMLAQRLMIQVISAELQLGLIECFGGERNCLLKKQVRRIFPPSLSESCFRFHPEPTYRDSI